MLYFNVCLLMFRPQTLFDALLRPAIENPRVTAIQFILDESEKERWRDDVMPKIKACVCRLRENAAADLVPAPRKCIVHPGRDGT